VSSVPELPGTVPQGLFTCLHPLTLFSSNAAKCNAPHAAPEWSISGHVQDQWRLHSVIVAIALCRDWNSCSSFILAPCCPSCHPCHLAHEQDISSTAFKGGNQVLGLHKSAYIAMPHNTAAADIEMNQYDLESREERPAELPNACSGVLCKNSGLHD
jgi:hypothetical protein